MSACPVDAISVDAETGAKVVSDAACVGCKVCTIACPFGTVNYNADTGKVIKCDLCGGDPVCVKACSTRPEMLNKGKQYNRLPVLFYEEQPDFNRVSREEPVARDEVGIMQAMLEAGKISSGA